MQERREAERVEFVGRATVDIVGTRVNCVARDVSETGILLLPPLAAAVGTDLRVRFLFPGLRDWIDLPGTIARVTEVDGKYAWGVAFGEMDRVTKQMLRSYVRRCTGRPSTGNNPAIATATVEETTETRPFPGLDDDPFADLPSTSARVLEDVAASPIGQRDLPVSAAAQESPPAGRAELKRLYADALGAPAAEKADDKEGEAQEGKSKRKWFRWR